MNFNQIYIFPLATHLGMSHKNNSISLFIHEQFSIGNDKNMIDADTKILDKACEICGQQFAKIDLKKQHLTFHFKEKLLADIKAASSFSIENGHIYNCPVVKCQFKSDNKWKTLRHYAVVHNIVEIYLKDYLMTNEPVLPLKSSGQFSSFQGKVIQDHEEQCPICKRVFQTKQGLGNYQSYHICSYSILFPSSSNYFHQKYIFYLVIHFGMTHKQSNLVANDAGDVADANEVSDASVKIVLANGEIIAINATTFNDSLSQEMSTNIMHKESQQNDFELHNSTKSFCMDQTLDQDNIDNQFDNDTLEQFDDELPVISDVRSYIVCEICDKIFSSSPYLS